MKYEIEEKDNKHCLECGHELHYGRGDKKFCNSRCRNKYHNKEKRDKQDHKTVQSRVDRTINKNYTILRNLTISGFNSVDIGQLIQWGFNPDYMTANRRVGKRNECWCFEIKYNLTPTKIMNLEFDEGVSQTNRRNYNKKIK